MENKDASKERKTGILISYVSLIASVLVYVLYTPFLLKKVGDTQYGIKAFVDSITSLMLILSVAMSSSYIRFATIEKTKDGDNGVKRVNGIFLRMLSIAAILAALVGIFVFAFMVWGIIPLNNYSAEDKNLIFPIYLLSLLVVIINIFTTIFTLFEEFNQKYTWLRLLSLFGTILRPIASIPFLILGYNIIAVELCLLCVDFLLFISNMLFSLKKLKMLFSFSHDIVTKNLTKQIIVFSSYILLNVIVDEVNSNADKMILGFMGRPIDVTIYQLGMMFSTYLIMASTAISSSFIPKINALVVANDYDEVNRTFLRVSELQMCVILTIVGGFAVCGKDFVIGWVGASKKDVYYVALILLLLNSVPLTENVGIEVQRALNKHKFRAIAYVVISTVNILISVLLVYLLPDNDAVWGCIIGTVFAVISGTWIAMNIYNYKVIRLAISKYILIFLKYFLCTGALSGILVLVFYFYPLSIFSNYWVRAIIEGVCFLIPQLLILFLLNRRKILNFIAAKRRGKNGQ